MLAQNKFIESKVIANFIIFKRGGDNGWQYNQELGMRRLNCSETRNFLRTPTIDIIMNLPNTMNRLENVYVHRHGGGTMASGSNKILMFKLI